MNNENELEIPQGNFALDRYPHSDDPNLRAWDAADEYILGHIAEKPVKGPTLILNDEFGAIAIVLATVSRDNKDVAGPITSVSDSCLSTEAAKRNLKACDLPASAVKLTPGPSMGRIKAGTINTLILKIPRTLALLEDQLHVVRPLLAPKARIVAGGMTKNIHDSTLGLFEQILGPTKTSLAVKKSRLIHTRLDAKLKPGKSRFPDKWEDMGIKTVNHANVFSGRSLDVGTRFMLETLGLSGHLADKDDMTGGRVMPGGQTFNQTTFRDRDAIDLGCGNGILGTALALANPDLLVRFVDESYQAIESAKATFKANLGAKRKAVFKVGNMLEGIDDDSIDLVMCNPPFHVQGARGDDTAMQMFLEAARVLKPGGSLYVVGNRHLGYHTKLRRDFSAAAIVGSNSKFVVVRAEV